MGTALACAVPCERQRSPSFDRTGWLTILKQRWLRQPRRALSLHTLRRRFQERVGSRSTSREMWITGCGNYDFWPDKSLQPTAFCCGSTIQDKSNCAKRCFARVLFRDTRRVLVVTFFKTYFLPAERWSRMAHSQSHSSGRGRKLNSFRAFWLEAPRRRVA